MIYKTINATEFSNWLANSGDYKNNFSHEGAMAIQQYYENLSDELGENIGFTPVVWCCEWAEYKNINEAYKEHYGDDTDLPVNQRRITKEQKLEYFSDNTDVITLENGGVLVRQF